MNLRLLHNPQKASPPFFGEACPSESIFRRERRGVEEKISFLNGGRLGRHQWTNHRSRKPRLL